MTIDQVSEMLDRQVNHMVRLVDDLMEMPRITRSQIELQKERIELSAVIQSAIEISTPLDMGANLHGPAARWQENFIHGAPPLAPLLFPNLVLLALVGLGGCVNPGRARQR